MNRPIRDELTRRPPRPPSAIGQGDRVMLADLHPALARTEVHVP